MSVKHDWIPDWAFGWGRVEIPNALFNHARALGLRPPHIALIIAMYACRRSQGIFPSIARLAELVNATERSVRRWIKELQELGLLNVEKHRRGYRYDLRPLWSKLRSIALRNIPENFSGVSADTGKFVRYTPENLSGMHRKKFPIPENLSGISADTGQFFRYTPENFSDTGKFVRYIPENLSGISTDTGKFVRCIPDNFSAEQRNNIEQRNNNIRNSNYESNSNYTLGNEARNREEFIRVLRAKGLSFEEIFGENIDSPSGGGR